MQEQLFCRLALMSFKSPLMEMNSLAETILKILPVSFEDCYGARRFRERCTCKKERCGTKRFQLRLPRKLSGSKSRGQEPFQKEANRKATCRSELVLDDSCAGVLTVHRQLKWLKREESTSPRKSYETNDMGQNRGHGGLGLLRMRLDLHHRGSAARQQPARDEAKF